MSAQIASGTAAVILDIDEKALNWCEHRNGLPILADDKSGQKNDGTEAHPQVFYRVQSCDKEEFKVSEEALKHSKVLYKMATKMGPEEAKEKIIDVNEFDSATLEIVFEWCEHHKGETIIPGESWISDFDHSLLMIDFNWLLEVSRAALYLNIEGLLYITDLLLYNKIL